jgi:hypothetical protein
MLANERKEKVTKGKDDNGGLKFISNDGEGTITRQAADGSLIKRVDHKWQQKQGGKISDDGFMKKGASTIVMPKHIDINTPAGNAAAGQYVKDTQAAVTRGKKMLYTQQQEAKGNGIAGKTISPQYKEGWDRIFGEKN